jgi:hypothetical protein
MHGLMRGGRGGPLGRSAWEHAEPVSYSTPIGYLGVDGSSRVGAGLATRTPHRTVLALFTHTALHCIFQSVTTAMVDF